MVGGRVVGAEKGEVEYGEKACGVGVLNFKCI